MKLLMVEFHDGSRGLEYDLQIPDFLTGEELVATLTKVYDLPINIAQVDQLYMRAENPIALISGKWTLAEIGISDGTRIYLDPR